MLLASACSGVREFGVEARADGTLHVMSTCTDVGFERVDVTSESDAVALDAAIAGFRAEQDGPYPRTVTISVDALASVPAGHDVRIEADYSDPILFPTAVRFRLDDLIPGTVVVSDSATEDDEIETISRSAFVEGRSVCNLSTRTKSVVRVASVGILAVGAGVWLVALVRRRRRARVTC